MGSLAQKSPKESSVTLTLMTGREKGRTFKVLRGHIRIGRDSDNDIVINDDPKVSRHHAEVTISASGVTIKNLSERNALVVDGQPCDQAIIRNKSIITIGDTELEIGIKTPRSALALGNALSQALPSHERFRGKNAKKTSSFTWVAIAVLAGLVWYATNEQTSQRAGIKIRTQEDVEAEITRAEQLRSQYLAPGGSGSIPGGSIEAHEKFLTGFRDFQAGRYGRALQSFQACLSLNPNHPICRAYLTKAQKKQDELIQRTMVLGREYRDRNQFSACQAAFKNVMIMIRDRSNPTYQEAKANFDACSAAVRGRF